MPNIDSIDVRPGLHAGFGRGKPPGAGRHIRSVVTAGLMLATLSGCSAGSESDGLANRPAAEAQQAAIAALRDTKSIHVIETNTDPDKPARYDLRVQGSSSSGTVTLKDTQFEITTVDQDVYFKGDQAAWQALEAPPPVAGFAGRWVKLRARQLDLKIFSLNYLVSQLTDEAWRSEQRAERATVDGKTVVALTKPNGSKLYISNANPAHPVRIEDKSDGSRLDFLQDSTDVQIVAPAEALDNALTPDESAWLDAVNKLPVTMNSVFENSPSHLTPTTLRRFADELRNCSRELARIGASSDRFQPVYALVQQACAEYDKGAECIAVAAGIGFPEVGSDESRRFDEALDCGFASSEAGRTLRDAVDKSDQIRSKL